MNRDPHCQNLSSLGLPAGKVLCALLVLSVALPAAQAGPVVDGREWRQLSGTQGLTWDEIAEGDQPGTEGDEGGVCPVGGGLCSGSVGELVFDGWTWATSTEVANLFRQYQSAYDRGTLTVATNDEGLNDFLSDFEPTGTSPEYPSVHIVEGWTADEPRRIEEWNNIPHELMASLASVNRAVQVGIFRTGQEIPSVLIGAGVWLYRPARDGSEDAETSANGEDNSPGTDPSLTLYTTDLPLIPENDNSHNGWAGAAGEFRNGLIEPSLPLTCRAVRTDGTVGEGVIRYGITRDGLSFRADSHGGRAGEEYYVLADVEYSEQTDLIVVAVIEGQFHMLSENGLVGWDGHESTLTGLSPETWNAGDLPLVVNSRSLSTRPMDIYFGFHDGQGRVNYCNEPMEIELQTESQRAAQT